MVVCNCRYYSEGHASVHIMQSVIVKSVDLSRGPGGFGFTLSSQGPCVLSCILASSPAHKAGLRPGDQILYVNGSSVEKSPHEQVVKLIARSPNGIVNLGVRNRAEVTATKPESHDLIEKETVVNENILNSVDKVVEELKSGQLTLHKQTPVRHDAHNDQIINEDEIVSDEELKASFTETIRSESSSDSVFINQNHIIGHRRASEGDCLPSYNSNRLRYSPVLIENDNNNDDKTLCEPDLTAIVGYLGSIELPGNSSQQTASLNAIRSCVRRLRAQQKVHVVLLLEVSTLGIRLIDDNGKTIVTYPMQSLALTGVCADDKKVFGVVTKKENESPRPNSWHTNDEMDISVSRTVACSCHVFTVDPEICSHENHSSIAQRFHIECNTVNGKCKQFLDSSSPILHAIDNLFIRNEDSHLSDEKYFHSHSSKQSTSFDNENAHSHSQNIRNQGSRLEDQELVNECVMETPKHRIHVRVTDCPETSEPISSWPSVEEEPFRHRLVQIERVHSLSSKKGKNTQETSLIPRNNGISLTDNNCEKKENDIIVSFKEKDESVKIGQTAECASDTNGGSPDSQMSADRKPEDSFGSRISNSQFFGNPKMRLSYSAEVSQVLWKAILNICFYFICIIYFSNFHFLQVVFSFRGLKYYLCSPSCYTSSQNSGFL